MHVLEQQNNMIMETYKTTIANNLIKGNWTSSQYAQMRKTSDAVDYAWNNWDESVLKTYYEGEKPQYPTPQFIQDWVDNEDFHADGFDVNYLKSLFE